MSKLIKDGGPAFPHAQRLWDSDAQSWAVHSIGGMTLRDYFAAAALTGSLANGRDLMMSERAEDCYYYADAMIAARERKQ
jgi:hypothetical protein